VRRGLAHLLSPSLDDVWAVVAVLLPVGATLLVRTQAIDLAYQIRAGEVMLDTGSVLRTDTFTYTVGGEPWLNQQWGAQVALAAVFRLGGWPLLDLTRAALVAITCLFIYRACRANEATPRLASVLTLAGWLVGSQIVTMLRPQQFAFALFAATLWAIATRHEHPYRVWLVPALVVVWANVHGSFPLAIAVLTGAWLEDRRGDVRLAKTLVAAAGLSIIASFVNPYGPGVWRYVVELSTHPIVSRRVAEWGPPSIHTPTGQLFFASLFVIVAIVARRGRRLGWLPLLTLGVYATLSLLAIRGVAWWGLAIPLIVAAQLADLDQPRASDRSPRHMVFIVALAGLAVVGFASHRGLDPRTGAPTMLAYAPERLVTAVRAEVEPGDRVFVSQLYASWAGFSAPGILVHVDPRIEIFPEHVWDEHFSISDGREGWDELLDDQGVRALILESSQAAGLLEVLPTNDGWRLLIETEEGAAYVSTAV